MHACYSVTRLYDHVIKGRTTDRPSLHAGLYLCVQVYSTVYIMLIPKCLLSANSAFLNSHYPAYYEGHEMHCIWIVDFLARYNYIHY